MDTPCNPQQQVMGIQILDTSSAIVAHVFTLPTPSAWAVTDEPCQTPNGVSAAATHGQALAHPCRKAVCIPALLLRPDLCAPHSPYFSSCTISWLGCTGRIQLVSSHSNKTPRVLFRSTRQSLDRKVSAVSSNGLKCSFCTGQWGGESPHGHGHGSAHEAPQTHTAILSTCLGHRGDLEATCTCTCIFSPPSHLYLAQGRGVISWQCEKKSLFILSGRALCAVRASQLTCVLTGDIIWGADRGALVSPAMGGYPQITASRRRNDFKTTVPSS